MRQERAENGTFKSPYQNCGDTVVMRVPRTYQKLFRELATILDELESVGIDSNDILSGMIEGLTNKIVETKTIN